MIKAIALDDEPLALKIIEKFCSEIDFIHLEKTFHKQSEALKYLNKFPIDLLFLDIQMPQKNGLEFYKNIDKNTKVIFTTAYTEYAVDAFDVNAIDYLVKPFSFERFLKAVEKLESTQKKSSQEVLFVRADYKLHKISVEEILFVESLDDYIKIHTINQPVITTRLTMKHLQEKLPSNRFLRVHRSYLVALHHIESMISKSIKIQDYIIPIGEKYKSEIQNFKLK